MSYDRTDTDDGDHESVNQIRNMLRHNPEDAVTERLTVPSALWGRIALEKLGGQSMESFILNLLCLAIRTLYDDQKRV